jgi:hypothetical protein
MNQETPPPLPVEFKDRKTSLTIFGILTILAGLLCSLFVPFMIYGQSVAAQAANGQHHSNVIAMPVGIYGGLAITLIVLGIGSIMARRWARALLLIISASTLITGLIAMAALAMMSGKIWANMQVVQPSSPALPESARWAILLVMGAFFGVIFVILPAIWTFFYGRPSVKATCEARDPVVRWTDCCPLPLLAASLFLGFGALAFLLTAFSFHGAIPFFGIFLVGLPGELLYLVLAAFWIYAAWAMYRLDSRGWWAAFIGLCLFPISAAITYHQLGIMEFYKLAGYSGKELATIQQFSFLQGNNAAWLTLASAVPWLAYLLFVKRYFNPSPAPAPENP